MAGKCDRTEALIPSSACCIRGSPQLTLFGTTVGFFAGFAAVSLYGPTAKQFKTELDLSTLQVSLLVSAPAASGALLRIPFAAWVDKAGGRMPFLTLMCMSILGLAGLLAVLRQSERNHSLYYVLLALGVLIGCGIALFSVGVGQIAYWYPQRDQGRVLAIFAGVGNIAPGIAALLVPHAVSAFGLETTYLIWLALLALSTCCYACTAYPSPYFQLRSRGVSAPDARKQAAVDYHQELFPSGGAIQSIVSAAGEKNAWLLVAVYFATFGGLVALTSWLPTYWSSLHSLEPSSAGALTALYSSGGSLIRVPGGSLADRVGGKKTLVGSLGVMALGAALMTFTDDLWTAVCGIVLLAMGMGIANAAVFKLVPQAVPHAVGGASGLIGGLGALGGFLLPPAMAVFVTAYGRSGYAMGFGVLLGMSIVSMFAVAALSVR
eukprot:TRINITY_DN16526_c0_g1_i1.p1 TRINITY_DN16526_c0_g1~~TRINITY_DN16526_c0_g1_i1.p1  ORF type:complete len:435 (-),score=40.99 TRINITY_DN16526_c0_g1_i1:64-1368(-)